MIAWEAYAKIAKNELLCRSIDLFTTENEAMVSHSKSTSVRRGVPN